MSLTEEAVQEKIQKKQERTAVRDYTKRQRVFIMTSRFNTQPRGENQKFRDNSWQNGCLYCTPAEVSSHIPLLAKMMVLEMDNDTNQIFAIGMCSNKSILGKYKVYENQNYNRYNYIGKHRILRNEFNEKEEAVFKALDQLCFFGNEHMKRGYGLRAFPVKMLMRIQKVINIPEFLENMFSSRFS